MDSLLPQLLSFPPHPPPAIPLSDADVDRGLRSVVKLLNETPSKKLTSGLSGGGGGDLLEILDPSINTLPFLFTLLAHLSSTQSGKHAVGSQASPLLPSGRLWEPMMRFMENFDPVQVRYAGAEFRRLLVAVEGTARKAALPVVAIKPMQLAISRLDPSGACYTSNHLNLLQLCMETRSYHMAIPVLDKDIYSFPLDPKPGTPLTHYPSNHKQRSSNYITIPSGLTDKVITKDILQYFLLGGMIYTCLRNWERAIHFYSAVLIAPATNAVSKIQVEAYNKRLLVGILWKGIRLDMPKTVTPSTAKLYRAMSKAYEAVAEIFQDSIRDEATPRRLIAELEAGQDLWQDDFNIGLCQQVMLAFRKFTVLKLAKTYASITISDVTKCSSSDPGNVVDTANYLQWLITTGQLNASIAQRGTDPQGWILKFHEEGPSKSEAQQLRDLKNTEARVQDLAARIMESDRKIGLSKEYLEWCRKAEAKGKEDSSGSGIQGMMDEFMHDDEDVMGA